MKPHEVTVSLRRQEENEKEAPVTVTAALKMLPWGCAGLTLPVQG